MNRIGIDIGGTFTDVVLDKSGRIFSKKYLTTPDNPEVGALAGINKLLMNYNLKVENIDTIVHGTTIAANALIERKGAKTALITTEGFRDVLEMRYEKRFDQYDLGIELPRPLVPRELRVCLNERTLITGEILKKPTESQLKKIIKLLIGEKIEAVAIAFLHSYSNPKNEQLVAKYLRQNLPKSVTICISSEISPEAREFERFSTTVANAYVRPLMSNYLNSFHQTLEKKRFKGNFFLMSSSGGLTSLEQAKKVPIRLVESGPAGGIILASKVSKELQEESSIALDIGGTTAKVCYLNQSEPFITRRLEVAHAWKNKSGSGLPLRIPAMDLVEIGAGGGSIAKMDTLGRLAVGPESAASQPGPACYNLGGEKPTVTDANLVIGRISEDSFGGGFINLMLSNAKKSIKKEIVKKLHFKSTEWAASGIIEIGEELMANAVRIHGIELGKNIRDCCLIVSGGGGPIHAAGIANKLDIRKIIVPHLAGVGSAVGFLEAPISYEIAQSISKFLGDLKTTEVKKIIKTIKQDIKSILKGASSTEREIQYKIDVELRYEGQGHDISIPIENYLESKKELSELTQKFVVKYQEKFGFLMPGVRMEIVSLIVSGKLTDSIKKLVDPIELEAKPQLQKNSPKKTHKNRKIFEIVSGKFISYEVFDRETLQVGVSQSGPCLIHEDQTTTVVPRGWDVSKHIKNHLVLTKI